MQLVVNHKQIYLRLVKNVDSAKQKKIKATPYIMKNMNIMKGSEC